MAEQTERDTMAALAVAREVFGHTPPGRAMFGGPVPPDICPASEFVQWRSIFADRSRAVSIGWPRAGVGIDPADSWRVVAYVEDGVVRICADTHGTWADLRERLRAAAKGIERHYREEAEEATHRAESIRASLGGRE